MKQKLLSITFGAMLAVFSFGTASLAQGNNVLIEVSKGTWCQWCPCADNYLHQTAVIYPDVMILNYHMWNNDPFQNFYGSEIRIMHGFTAIPTAVIGRRTGLLLCSSGQCYSAWNNQLVTQTLNIQPGVNISITKTYNAQTRVLEVTANVTALRQIDSLCNINFVITESSIIHWQSGNSICPGSETWVHDWVTRSMVNGAAGEQLSTVPWNQGITLTRSWTTALPSGWVDANCTANIFVFKQSNDFSAGSHVLQTIKQTVTGLVGITGITEIPKEYSLSQNYPNPFNPTTNIKFSIPEDGYVSLKIYDMTGSVVQTYIDGNIRAGTYNAEVDGSNLSSGVYFYTLFASKYIETKKMVLIK